MTRRDHILGWHQTFQPLGRPKRLVEADKPKGDGCDDWFAPVPSEPDQDPIDSKPRWEQRPRYNGKLSDYIGEVWAKHQRDTEARILAAVTGKPGKSTKDMRPSVLNAKLMKQEHGKVKIREMTPDESARLRLYRYGASKLVPVNEQPLLSPSELLDIENNMRQRFGVGLETGHTIRKDPTPQIGWDDEWPHMTTAKYRK